ncbi:MAG: acyltransferase family protein, partial [Bacteroidota bacterium]|nr:acyltransferase family protein [Bacteroidota bacterium]
NTKRFPLPDLLKGFAVFLIIPVHILETFIDYPGRESLFGKVLLLLGGPFGVPIFMMVMGYFVALSKKTTAQNILRGLLIFILGIFLNIGLNFHLLLKIWTEGWKFDPLQAIFGVDIFYLAGLSIILLSVLKTLKYGQQWIAFALILFVSGSTAYMNEILMVTERNYILPFIGGKYSWSYFPLFPWLTYPLVGFLFQKTELRLRNFMQKQKTVSIAFLAFVFILVVLFSRFGIETTINLSDYYHHTFPFFLWTLGVDVLWILLLWFVVQKFSEFPIIVFLRWLGKNITAFYIIQWLIIGNIATAIYQTQELSKYAYWFVPIFLITIGLTFMYEKIKSSYSKI